ncbi:preprotein translocase subunit SecG [Candidatus Omnitrophota bacterium]
MLTVILTIHAIVCALLIVFILIQRGRGGGLVESFSGVESMFGTKTSALLTRMTTILSIVFFSTCLILALMAAKRSKSLMRSVTQEQETTDAVQQEAIPEADMPLPEAQEDPGESAPAPLEVPEIE